MRRGVQFGPELTAQEKATGVTAHGRGLLFACYQTNLFNGFQFLQHSEYFCTSYYCHSFLICMRLKGWANNADFQPFETQPEKPGCVPLFVVYACAGY